MKEGIIFDTPVKSKVVELLGTTTWTNKVNGTTVYYTKLRMENGETITLGKNKENAFSVGQEIEYKHVANANGGVSQKEIQSNSRANDRQSSKKSVQAYSRQVAIQAAAHGGGTVEEVIKRAEIYLAWINRVE